MLQLDIDNLLEPKLSEKEIKDREKKQNQFWGSSIPEEDTKNEPPNKNR
jgi:hypothetical protein